MNGVPVVAGPSNSAASRARALNEPAGLLLASPFWFSFKLARCSEKGMTRDCVRCLCDIDPDRLMLSAREIFRGAVFADPLLALLVEATAAAARNLRFSLASSSFHSNSSRRSLRHAFSRFSLSYAEKGRGGCLMGAEPVLARGGSGDRGSSIAWWDV